MKQLEKVGLVVIGIVFVIGIIFLARFVNEKLNPSYEFRASPTTVIKELRKLNRLETASYTIEKVIDAGTSGNRFQELLFGDQLLHIAHGEVIAGVDLSKLAGDDIAITEQTLRLTLPAPQILSTRLDSEQTRVYDRRQGLLTKGDKDLESSARAEAEKIIRQAACEGNILTEATNNARSQLTALFKSLGFTTVIIEIPRGNC